LSLLVVLYDIGALLGLAAAGLALVVTHGALFATSSLMAIGIYLGVLIMGHFLWKGFGWARIAFMAILVLDLIRIVPGCLLLLRAGLPAVGAVGWLAPLLEIVLDGLFLVILTSARTREYCRR
jgi:hypothetical protein